MGELAHLPTELSRSWHKAKASQDSDLIAFEELKIYGFTDTVENSRADALEDVGQEQFYQEIQWQYGLSNTDLLDVIHSVIGEIEKENAAGH